MKPDNQVYYPNRLIWLKSFMLRNNEKYCCGIKKTKQQPYHELPQMRVKPVKKFMQRSLIKQDIHVAKNKDALKRNMGSQSVRHD